MTRSPGMGFVAGAAATVALALFISPPYSQQINTATHTFTNVDFGAEDPNRYVLIFVGFRSGSNGGQITSATIGGVAATIITQVPVTGGNPMGAGWIGALVPTGLTGTVVVTHNVNQTETLIAVYQSITILGLTPSDTLNVYNGAADPTGLIDVPARGLLLAGASSGGTATNAWTGVVEDFDTVVNARTFSGGNLSSESFLLNHTVTDVVSVDNNNNMSCFSIGPAT